MPQAVRLDIWHTFAASQQPMQFDASHVGVHEDHAHSVPALSTAVRRSFFMDRP
jgi:hypothetical protein